MNKIIPFLYFVMIILMVSCQVNGMSPSVTQDSQLTITEIPPLATPTVPIVATITSILTPTVFFTPTTSPKVIPSETPEPFVVPSFKLAYSILDGPLQGRWVLDTASETPFRVAQRYPGNVNWPWSHNGLRMAVVNNPDGQTLIEMIDLETEITSTIFLPNIPRFSSNFHFRGTLHWSSDDRWLAYYESGEVGYDFVVKTWLIDTNTREVIELPTGVYFSSWSYAVPDQYLYLFLDIPPRSSPEENVERQTSIHIGQVGIEEPVYSFPDMGIENTSQFGWDILLSPDGRLAVSRANDREANHRVIKLFFETDTWEIVQRDPSFDFLPFLWSPDSKWIILWKGNSIYLWEVEQSSEPFALKLPKDVRPLAWTPDSHYLIYYKDNYLYVVNPARIEQPIPFFDLSSLNLSQESLYSLDLWVGSD